MSSLDKHIISKPRYFLGPIVIVATALIVFFTQSYFVQQSSQSNAKELTRLRSSHEYLLTEQQQLTQDNTKLNSVLTHQEQLLAIQEATNNELQAQLNSLQNSVISLKKELVFYQTINQGNNTSKLQIRELHLRADKKNPDIFQYFFVVTQGKNISKPITGIIAITLNGTKNDEPIKIPLAEHPLTLRHVQVLEGQLKLADNIKPKSFTVTLKQKKKITLTQTFDWKTDSSD